MRGFYDTLKIEYGKCPPDCSACVDACVAAKKGRGPEDSRIVTVRAPEASFSGALTCLQCGEPGCAAVCPTGAITKSETDGTVRIAEEKCVGCALCSVGCQYGGVLYDAKAKKSFKCDRCDGAPKCVEACEHGVLTYERTSTLRGYLRADDPFVHGTGLCFGCPAELALRLTLRILGSDTIVFGAPGCACQPIIGLGTQATAKVPTSMCLMTNVPSTMTGVKRYYRSQGKDVRCVAFVGDGATVDIGFQPLSGAAERGENLIYICYDNEGYMNTGIQRSSSTSFHAWTNTSPVGKFRRGKEEVPKNVPLLMAFHGIPYVATANIGYLEDYAQKLQKAAQVTDGLVYIHLLSPCPTGWRARTDSAVDICQAAVQTNFFPLWEAENGKFRITTEVKNPKPIREYLKLMGKYSHLTDEEIEGFQGVVDAGYKTIEKLSTL